MPVTPSRAVPAEPMPGRSRRPRRGAMAAALLVAAAGLAAVGAVAGSAVLSACTGGQDPPAAGAERIADVQGTTRISPLEGEQVADIPGIVTATRASGPAGFWLQDPDAGDDPRSSDALFVSTEDHEPRVSPGDALRVSGLVRERYPDDDNDPDGEGSTYPPTTELTGARWTVESTSNPLPEPELITPDTVPGELVAQPGGAIDDLPLEPQAYATDFWESRESMLVAVEDARVVGPTTDFDELYITGTPAEHPSPRGGAVYTGYGNDPTGVLKVESLLPPAQHPLPRADTGDTLTGRTSGPVNYERFGGYTLHASELGELAPGGLERQSTREQRAGELAVASYNMENLSGVDTQSTFDELAAGITENLAGPDILALVEVQDNTGADGEGGSGSDAVARADVTLDRLSEAIAEAGGPDYEWRQIDPEPGADGGQPGGNIRVAFLYDPERISFVDRPGGDATTPVEVEEQAGQARISVSPGRIEPGAAAWEASRKSLVGEFDVDGETLFVVANHFTAKLADQPADGLVQPPQRSSEQQRVKQAASVRGFVDELIAAEPHARVMVAGDLNDFGFSPTMEALTSGGQLRSLMDTLPAPQRYTYIFRGRAQVLDHILVSPAIEEAEFEVVHMNAEFHDQLSDHDPVIARLRLGEGAP